MMMRAAGMGMLLISAANAHAVVGEATGASLSEAAERPQMTPAHAKAMLQRQFQNFDCENQGRIFIGEVDDHFAQLWLPADGNQNQKLTPREYQRTHLGTEEAVEGNVRAR